MIVRTLLLAFFGSLLVFTGCRKAEVTSYRVPKEKDPEMPVAAAAPAGDAGSAPASAAPSSAPAMASTPVATADGAGLTWKAPATWSAKPASAMRKATYMVPGDNGTSAELSITAFPGTVGGELANLNRWRGQLSLPPISEGELAAAVNRQEHNGLKFGVVDLAGTGAAAQRILGAWVLVGDSTWFFKLTGPDAVVAKQKSAFTAFIATVKPATGSAAP